MKRILTGLLAGAILLTLACGEEEVVEEEKKPVWVKPEAGKGPQPAPPLGNSSRDRIEAIRVSKNMNDRLISIRRAGRVDLEGRKDMIPLLMHTLENASNSVEKAAAAQALIEIGTDKALAPVKEAMVLGINQVISSGIMEKLRRKHGSKYKDIIKSWCLELLNDANTIENYTVNQVLAGLNMFAFAHKPGTAGIIEPSIYLQDKRPRLLNKMYELMEKYPADKMPTATIRDRLQEQFKKKKLNLREARAVMGLLQTKLLQPEEMRLRIELPSVKWGLGERDFEIREATLTAVRLGWRGFKPADRDVIKALVEDLAKNDRTWIEGEFVIQKRAKETLKAIK